MKLFYYLTLAFSLALIFSCGNKGEDMLVVQQSDDCWRRTDGTRVTPVYNPFLSLKRFVLSEGNSDLLYNIL